MAAVSGRTSHRGPSTDALRSCDRCGAGCWVLGAGSGWTGGGDGRRPLLELDSSYSASSPCSVVLCGAVVL